MKKSIKMGIFILLTMVLLAGCGNQTMPLAEVFQQEQLEQQTIQIVLGNAVLSPGLYRMEEEVPGREAAEKKRPSAA